MIGRTNSKKLPKSASSQEKATDVNSLHQMRFSGDFPGHSTPCGGSGEKNCQTCTNLLNLQRVSGKSSQLVNFGRFQLF